MEIEKSFVSTLSVLVFDLEGTNVWQDNVAAECAINYACAGTTRTCEGNDFTFSKSSQRVSELLGANYEELGTPRF